MNALFIYFAYNINMTSLSRAHIPLCWWREKYAASVTAAMCPD